MKTAKEIAKKKMFEFIEKTFPDREFENTYEVPEWMIEAMKEYALKACEEQREMCSQKAEFGKHVYSISLDSIRNAPEPELK